MTSQQQLTGETNQDSSSERCPDNNSLDVASQTQSSNLLTPKCLKLRFLIDTRFLTVIIHQQMFFARRLTHTPHCGVFALWWVGESSAAGPFPPLAPGEGPLLCGCQRSRSEEEGWKNSAADIYPPRPHESRMWKLTPALSLHFLRVPIVYVFVWMTVDFSASLSSGFVGPC